MLIACSSSTTTPELQNSTAPTRGESSQVGTNTPDNPKASPTAFASTRQPIAVKLNRTDPTSTAGPTRFPQTPAPSSIWICQDTTGNLEGGELYSEIMGSSMRYQVYLPPCYGFATDQRYPTLYLLHGQGFTETQWERLGMVSSADLMISGNEVSPFIMVMPREPPDNHSKQSQFDSAVAKELIPAIDKKYHTNPFRQYRAVGGLSRGAGWAIELGLDYWELFSAVGAHSPAVFNTNPFAMENRLKAIPMQEFPRLFIDIGDREPPSIIESAYWLGELLNRLDIPHEWYQFTGVHDERYWSGHHELYLRWYTGSW